MPLYFLIFDFDCTLIYKEIFTMTNYEIFVNTLKTLKSSQRFYSRLYNDFLNWSDDEHENAKNVLNNLPQWEDTVDCVMFLET